MTNIKSIIISLLLTTLLVACSSVDCDTKGRVTCNIAIQNEAGESYSIPWYLSVTITRSIDGNDTTIINKEYNDDTINLPMSYVGDSDEYTITLENDDENPTKTLTDKITISKTNKPYFDGIDCAPRYNHTITNLEYTDNFIESLELKNNYVTNNASITNIILHIRSLE